MFRYKKYPQPFSRFAYKQCNAWNMNKLCFLCALMLSRKNIFIFNLVGFPRCLGHNSFVASMRVFSELLRYNSFVVSRRVAQRDR